MPRQPDRAEFIGLINNAREERRISIRAAARIAGVPPATAQGWLAGSHFPTPALRPKFLKLVDALDLGHLVHPALWVDKAPHAEPERP